VGPPRSGPRRCHGRSPPRAGAGPCPELQRLVPLRDVRLPLLLPGRERPGLPERDGLEYPGLVPVLLRSGSWPRVRRPIHRLLHERGRPQLPQPLPLYERRGTTELVW